MYMIRHTVAAPAAAPAADPWIHIGVSVLFLCNKGLTTERSVQNPFRVRSGSIQGPREVSARSFRGRLGSARAPFGPIPDQNDRSQKFKISKILHLFFETKNKKLDFFGLGSQFFIVLDFGGAIFHFIIKKYGS